jgi:hypothetical protein
LTLRSSFASAALTAILALPLSCGREASSQAPAAPVPAPTPTPAPTPNPVPAPAAASVKTIHVFVALCDNKNQGIVPVPEKLGRGDDPDGNLYWGAA